MAECTSGLLPRRASNAGAKYAIPSWQMAIEAVCSTLGRPSQLSGQDAVSDGVANDRRRGLEVEFPMRRSAVCLNCLRAQTQDPGDVLVRVALGNQL